MGVGTVLALISLFGFGTTSGLYLLDVSDYFVNQFGIVAAAFVAVVTVAWLLRRLDRMVMHLNKVSSFRLGTIYKVLIAGAADRSWLHPDRGTDQPIHRRGSIWRYAELVREYLWLGMAIGLIVIAVILSLIPWPQDSALYTEHSSNEYPLDDLDVSHGRHASEQEPEQGVRP